MNDSYLYNSIQQNVSATNLLCHDGHSPLMRISRTFQQRWKHKLTKNHDNDSFYGNETTFYITLFILTNGGDFHKIFAVRVPLIFACAVCYTRQKHEDFSSMHRSLILTVLPHSGPFTKFLSALTTHRLKRNKSKFSHNP